MTQRPPTKPAALLAMHKAQSMQADVAFCATEPLAGVLGVMLAAPVMATVKLLGTYAWRKMFDLPPFPNPEKELEPSAPEVIIKRGREIISDLKKPETGKPKQ